MARSFEDGFNRASQELPDAAALFEEHANSVAGWASRLGGPALDVDDVVQEVFVIVHRRRGRFRGDSTLSSWLYGITANVVRQHRRKARRRRWFGIGLPVAIDEAAGPPTPFEEVERRQRSVAVYRVLDKMRETNRTMLILTEIEGLGGDAIAALTGLKIGTIWVRLHRARAEFSRLARKLIPEEVEAVEAALAPMHDDPRWKSR
ncbi:MAG TPA: RNA polymerase sigma factor [Polyangia bacterium]